LIGTRTGTKSASLGTPLTDPRFKIDIRTLGAQFFKKSFTADMLDTANSYDDKVALIRMLVAQESGRVALVLKNMVRN
jgi:hypothetical protein